MARTQGATLDTIHNLARDVREAKNKVLKFTHAARQSRLSANATDEAISPSGCLGRLWKLLRAYNNGRSNSSLPDKIYDNASPDPRIWEPSRLPSSNPSAWHRFRYALGHHLFGHPRSPYDEQAARIAHSQVPTLLRSIQSPTSTPDPLFTSPLSEQELEDEIKKLPPDKSPGEDGVTNRMIQSGGDHFRALLFELFQTLWEKEVQPKAWNMSLLIPIYKGGGKERADPASYRGIYLNSALAKLFEGILISRLTRFTEAHCTLTQNQLGTRPGLQIHDAIYTLISLITFNYHLTKQPTYVAFLDYSTAFPSVHRAKLLASLSECGIVGRMWMHLRARFQSVFIRVLHPRGPVSWSQTR